MISKRESEVLALVAAQMSNAQIAHRLRLSVRTVEHHVASLLRKYHVSDRTQLGTIAQLPQAAGLSGLPRTDTTFVGRAHERDAALLMLSTVRLVTLVGPGGVGKTRLATVLAEASAPQFPFGGAFVDLVPVRETPSGGSRTVADAVAAALGVGEVLGGVLGEALGGVPHQPLQDAIAARLQSGPTLLVLDNCEHVLDATAAFIQQVLATCPQTTILATSRERLGVPGERALPVAPLRLASEAEELFRDRALAADPGFAAPPQVIAEICGRLDGMPLAIELAAARSAALGATGLLAALENHLRVLSGRRGVDTRHRSLRDVIDWSHALLNEEESVLFRRLAAFAGTFDLSSAVRVTGAGDQAQLAEVLGRLTDKSLLTRAGGVVSRWRLLSTIRAYALERLQDGPDWTVVRQRHLRWAAETATDLESRLSQGWQDDFDAVADDLRAALAAAPPEPNATAHSLARSLGRLTYARRFLTEALEHFRDAARRAPDPAAAALDLRLASDAVYSFGHAEQSYELLLASADQARLAGDGNATAIALARAVETATRLPSGFSAEITHSLVQAQLAEAVKVGDPHDPIVAAHLAAAAAWSASPTKVSPDPQLARQAVAAARATRNPVLTSAALDAMVHLAAGAGRQREAYASARERLGLLSTLDRSDPAAAAEILDIFHSVTTCALAAGDLPGALAVAERIRFDHLLGTHPYRATSKLVAPLALMGRFKEALAAAETMWQGWLRAGSPVAAWMSPAVSAAALAHGLLGDETAWGEWRRRADLAGGLVTNPAAYGRNTVAFAVFVEARMAVYTSSLAGAGGIVERAFALPAVARYREYAQAAAAELAVAASLPDASRWIALAQPAATENDWAAACLARARGESKAARELWDRVGATFERSHTPIC